ncbi:MAG: arylesterase [Chthoniobacterales bacterium]
MGNLRVAFIVIALALIAANAVAQTKKNVVFLGDSLTAGYGVDPDDAFPALIEKKIAEQHLPYHVENAGVSGDTTAGGLSRIDWLLQNKIDVLVVELGGNDGLRGLPIEAMKSNLRTIIAKVRAKNPEAKIVIAGMRIPPNVGIEYSASFKRAFDDLAGETHATLIPFLLENVGGIRDLNQPDMIHPTAAGHHIIADTVWRVLEPILRQG